MRARLCLRGYERFCRAGFAFAPAFGRVEPTHRDEAAMNEQLLRPKQDWELNL